MDTFKMRRTASGFGFPVPEKTAVLRLKSEGIECEKLTDTTFLLLNGEPMQVKDAIGVATLESQENDWIPKKFFTQLAALKYLYNQGYKLSVE